MNDFARQVVHASRVLRKSPGFAVSALLILTLGIGANTAIFGIVDALLLKPLPFPKSDSVVSIYQVPPLQSFPGIAKFATSPANFLDWKKQNKLFEGIAALRPRAFQLGGAVRPEMIYGLLSDADFFRVTGVQPATGRGFTAAECQPGRDDVAVLSDGFARSHFGSPAAALRQTLQLNGRSYRVIGVMPRSFDLRFWFGANKDAWMPLAWTPEQAAVRGNHNLHVIARLKEGASVDQARTEMNVISSRLSRDFPEENKGWGATVVRLRDDLVGEVRPAILTLLGAVSFVLLIACANTANLVLARTITRRKEFAIRAALGAGVRNLLAPVLVETTMLSLAGGALGLLFARSAQSLVVRALAEQMPGAVPIELNVRVLAFTTIASVLTGLASGMLAAWRLARANVSHSLKSGLGKTDSDAGNKSTRGALVIAEVALSVVLLVGAGLMVRSLWSLYHVDPGFVPEGVTSMTVPIPKSAGGGRNRFYDELLTNIGKLPGVVSAGAIDTLPLTGGGSQQPIVIDGRPREVFALQPNVAVRIASPGYLETMRVPLVAGRGFVDADTDGGHPVALISREMARQFFPGENPIGKRLRSSFFPDVSREVVGVVGDVRERGLEVMEPLAIVYTPLEQNETGSVSLVVRTEGEASGLGRAVAHLLQEIDPELPLRDVLPMQDVVRTSLAQQRFSMLLFVALAGLAFALSAVGIYSVLAYTVRRRLGEIGIRMALGAGVADVVKLVLFEGMKPALTGIVLGSFGAWMLSGILERLVYGVSPTDAYAFGAAAAMLAAVAMLACLLPAWTAARADPANALRSE